MAGAERSLGMLPSVSQAFLPPQTPNFDQISPKRGPKSPHEGLGRPPEPERGPPASTRAAPTRAGATVHISIVTLYRKYTGKGENDSTVHGYLRR